MEGIDRGHTRKWALSLSWRSSPRAKVALVCSWKRTRASRQSILLSCLVSFASRFQAIPSQLSSVCLLARACLVRLPELGRFGHFGAEIRQASRDGLAHRAAGLSELTARLARASFRIQLFAISRIQSKVAEAKSQLSKLVCLGCNKPCLLSLARLKSFWVCGRH